MGHIYKVRLNDNKVYYKCDTFWTLSSDREHAKCHGGIGNEHLVSNLLSFANSSLKTAVSVDKTRSINYYDNMFIGFDYIIEKDIINFDFIKVGPWIYRLSYNKESDKFELIDISRKPKLERLNELSESQDINPAV